MTRALLRRPATLVAATTLSLAGLLTGGLLVAHAVEGTSPTSATSSSSGQGDNNAAVAVNGKDGKTVYAIRLKVVRASQDVVDATNAAVAVASCSDCTTVAIAFEGVLVSGSPSDFEPTNLALAYNVDCSGCTTFADAYQQVVQRSTLVRITGKGRRAIAAIRQDLLSLRKANLPLDQVVARVKADEQAFADVLLNEVVPVGHVTTPPPTDAPEVTATPSATDYQPVTAAPTTGGSSPSDSPTPSGSPTATATPTPSGTPSP
ncbi:MAG: hypothetical protein WCD35_02250 [Mycobacteriales bacterium]